jgi:hypothetical protein
MSDEIEIDGGCCGCLFYLGLLIVAIAMVGVLIRVWAWAFA